MKIMKWNLKKITNFSSLDIVKGSSDNGYVAYYAEEVIIVNYEDKIIDYIGDNTTNKIEIPEKAMDEAVKSEDLEIVSANDLEVDY